MKQYENPQLLIELLRSTDIISTSGQGTETTPKDETDGDFNLNIG